MTGAWVIALAAGEPDQAGRLRRFRAAHPAVDISKAGRTMRAWIPEQSGDRLNGREIVGYTLRDLLDKLDRADVPPADSPPGREAPPGGG